MKLHFILSSANPIHLSWENSKRERQTAKTRTTKYTGWIIRQQSSGAFILLAHNKAPSAKPSTFCGKVHVELDKFEDLQSRCDQQSK